MRLVILLALLPLAACAGAGMSTAGGSPGGDAGLTHNQRVYRDMQAILEGMQNAHGMAGTLSAAPLSGESVAPPFHR